MRYDVGNIEAAREFAALHNVLTVVERRFRLRESLSDSVMRYRAAYCARLAITETPGGGLLGVIVSTAIANNPCPMFNTSFRRMYSLSLSKL